MDRSELVRKAFHLSSPVWLAWYWIPPDAWVGVSKSVFLVVLLSGALLIEAVRLIRGRAFLGLRHYETDRVSAYAWGSLGLALGLLFFPGQLVVPTFWGMAWIDPLCAYTRKARGYPYAPLAAYFLLWVSVSYLIVPLATEQTVPMPVWVVLAFGAVAAVVAVAIEKPNFVYVDDDFLMFVGPLVALAALSTVV